MWFRNVQTLEIYMQPRLTFPCLASIVAKIEVITICMHVGIKTTFSAVSQEAYVVCPAYKVLNWQTCNE